ncbi:MAG TPA: bifunctional UDP-N-acetylmuramoyl-tripeptide:D-alanyl-D-alanine ligase/alanine racemase, partial [Bacteroidia bacterium]|nr:bifunctional UDP-N-acetylmuramoyl-tripeptide:D-alanyl-D-alanine ligase/alanine racemase [Bacteroidia bacterium]
MSTTPFSIEQIATVIGGQFFQRNVGHRNIEHLLTDSRKIVNAGTSLFFAITGDRRDGHEFIPDLYAGGVRNFVITKENYISEFPDCNFIIVGSTLDAMQQLAAAHRRRFDIPVVGITGSNGKTIVKEWLYQLLREDHHIVRSPKSYNSQIGVPLSVWQMRADNDLALFEAGISQPGEMVQLEKIIRPTIGIFTNIGTAHDENFASQQEKIDEKLRLFIRCKALIYCKDYAAITERINGCGLLPDTLKFVTWSRKGRADMQVGRIAKQSGTTEIQGVWKNDFIQITIPFTDDASIENAIQCWTLLLHLGYDNDVIARRMELLSPVAMRLEMKEGINNCSIINDSYNSDIGSLTIALDFLNQQQQHPSKTVVLSDILQSGRDEKQLYKEVAELVTKKNIKRVIGIGPAISRHADLFETEKTFFASTDDFLKKFSASQFHDETVLLKGARLFGFERISKVLQQKAHQTVLEINLNALVHNLNFYKSRLKPETKLMVMVKAFAYGSGSFEIASALQFHRADYLAVAYADEGVALRKGGITLPIMVMNPEEQSFDAIIRNNLEPEIYNFKVLQQFSDAVKRLVPEQPGIRVPIHIKIDTGMHRLGFEQTDINELVVRLKNLRYLKVVTVFSHLAGSDEADL